MDEAGATLFDFNFEGVPVADRASGPEVHFQFVLDLGPGGPPRLARVELIAGDGRQSHREARLSAPALADTLDAAGTFRVDPVDAHGVRLRWDAELFPLVLVRDPETNRVLAMARDGTATVMPAGEAVVVVVSEGVRSASRRIQVR